MSHTRVKTTFEQSGSYGGTEVIEIYCHHFHSTDTVDFYYKDGTVVDMTFECWSKGRDKWDAIQKLWFPFKDEWNGELLDGVEYYREAPWEK